MLALAIVLLALLPVIFADSAQCPEGTIAVNGYPKCYLFSYQSQGLDWGAQYNYCHKATVEGKEGRLFTPGSWEEMQSVQKAVTPQAVFDIASAAYRHKPRWYWTNYILYASPELERNVYASATYPHIPMPSGLWVEGEPNRAGEGADCTRGNYLISGKYGLGDYECSEKLNSVICEYPATIQPLTKTTITTALSPTTHELTTPRPTTTATTTTRPKHHGGGRKPGCNFNNKLIGGGWVEVLGEC